MNSAQRENGKMAIRVWWGEFSGEVGNWNEGHNWLDGAGDDAGDPPVNGDDVYIVSGSVSITGYDASAVTLDSLVVGSQYTGTIGSSGAKLQISSTVVDFSGKGVTYLEGDYVTFTVLDTATGSTALNISADGADDITTLRILGGSGNINLAASCDLTTIEQIGADGVTLSIAASVDLTGATLTMDSGIVEMGQAVPTIVVFGGELKSTIDSGTITSIDQYGGRIRWSPTASCTITTLTVYAGKFDSSNSTAPTFTITNTTLHDGELDERSGIENAVYTNPISTGSAEIKYDAGREITIN